MYAIYGQSGRVCKGVDNSKPDSRKARCGFRGRIASHGNDYKNHYSQRGLRPFDREHSVFKSNDPCARVVVACDVCDVCDYVLEEHISVADERAATDEAKSPTHGGREAQEECAKHGAVIGVVVPKPPDAVVATGSAGRCYVSFAEQAGAIAAQRALHGRTFGGNKVRRSVSTPHAPRVREPHESNPVRWAAFLHTRPTVWVDLVS